VILLHDEFRRLTEIDIVDPAISQMAELTTGAKRRRHWEHAAPPYWGDPNFSHPQQPVVVVSWFDADAYCAWLAAMTGSHDRLLTSRLPQWLEDRP
jgi:formylglycine-generating enzyme required for sulfatase activity